MKQFSAIFISFIYLTFSIGLVVNLHYCQGEIEEIDLIVENTSCCTETTSCCSDISGDEEDQCCSEIQHYFQVVPEILVKEQTKILVPLIEITFYQKDLLTSQQVPYCDPLFKKGFDMLPELHNEPLWVVHCAFTFYG